jgi:hypothetical protein
VALISQDQSDSTRELYGTGYLEGNVALCSLHNMERFLLPVIFSFPFLISKYSGTEISKRKYNSPDKDIKCVKLK